MGKKENPLAYNDIVEQIKDKADAVDVIGRVVKLRKAGRSWSGLCPFHSETDGSFHVYDDGHYHCFGCSANGDVIRFYERYYNLDFKAACERLGAEFGIDIDWGKGRDSAAEGRREALYRINADAANHYYKCIKKAGNPGLAYLLGRGVGAETIKAFGLGYADDGGRSFAQAVEGNKEKIRDAEEVGLLYAYGGGWRDRYRSRVMFPIVNTRGKVIGFGGRDLTGDPKAGKYINSRDSKAFSKGHNLYALYKAQQSIRERGFAVLVEGYMDAVALHMHGVTNAVAQLGTAFTPQQAKLLSRYTKNVVLALDSDASGRKAAEESGAILQEAGLKARVLVLEGAKDPDEFIRAFGREAFEDAASRALPLTEFRLLRLKEGYDTSGAEGLADYLKAAAALLGGLDPVEAEAYAKKLARETGVSETAIREQAERGRALGGAPPEDGRRGRADPAMRAESFDRLLVELLAYPLNAAAFLPRVMAQRHWFSDSVYAPILTAMNEAGFDASGEIDVAALRYLPAEEDQILLDAVLARAASPGAWSDRTFEELLRRAEIAILTKRSDELAEALRSGGDAEADVLTEMQELLKKIKQLETENRKAVS
ncbi:MAG: DNA primase [Clostridiales Family XIII bacterium]|jgi:DNA primase|nr:DNA primase [Clostridiales Family XIII bacterium]